MAFVANSGADQVMPLFSAGYAASAANWANGHSPGVS